MRKFALALLILTHSFFAQAATKPPETLPEAAQRVTKDVAAAHRAFSLRDGHTALIFRATPEDPNATAALLSGSGTEDQQIVAADYLPPDAMRTGHLGQVNGVALLDNGLLAVSVGWAAPEQGSRNAVIVLKQEGGTLVTEEVLDIQARDLVDGPDGTIIGLTTDWKRETDEEGPPLVTAFRANGEVLATLFPGPRANHSVATRQKLSSRLHRWRDGEYMLYREADQTVYRLRLVSESGRHRFSVEDSIPLTLTRDKSNFVKAIVPLQDGSFIVQRTVQVDGRARTELTQYHSGREPLSWSPAELYRLTFRNARGQLDGLRAAGAEAVREAVPMPSPRPDQASR